MNSHKKASLIMLLLLIYFIFIGDTIVISIGLIFPNLITQENIIFMQMIISTIYFSVPLLVYRIIKKSTFKELLRLNHISIKNIFVIILLSIFIQPFLQVINAFTLIFVENEIAGVLNIFLKAPFWQLLLAVAIFPSILEEVVFRGIFIKEYEKCSFWYGVIFSGVFFGIMHLTLNQLFYATIAGILMAILVKVTNSIYSSILAHFVLNGTQITFAYISNKILAISGNEDIVNKTLSSLDYIYIFFRSFIYFIISLPFLLGSIYLFIKINRDIIDNIKKEDIMLKENNTKVLNVFFISLIIVYLIYLILT